MKCYPSLRKGNAGFGDFRVRVSFRKTARVLQFCGLFAVIQIRSGSQCPSRRPEHDEDLDDTMRRLVAFAEAGADVLCAPGLKTPEDIGAVVRSVAPKPVNVVMGLAGPAPSLDVLASLGVKRVSLGSSLARAAYRAFLRAAREVRDEGTFAFAQEAVSYAEINAMFKR
jgi:2-methylisocitrate lyase-like PEP mutase family enzyme